MGNGCCLSEHSKYEMLLESTPGFKPYEHFQRYLRQSRVRHAWHDGTFRPHGRHWTTWLNGWTVRRHGWYESHDGKYDGKYASKWNDGRHAISYNDGEYGTY